MSNHTFVVMAYLDSPYLPECISSLQAQSVVSQIIIVTSTPSDYISKIANEFDVPLQTIEPKKGIAHDWNKSLHAAKSQFVTLAHQDDYYGHDYTKSCLEALEKSGDGLICFTWYSELVRNNDRKNTLLLRIKKLILLFFMPFHKTIKSKFWKKRLLSFGCPIPCPSVMYNRTLLENFQFSSEFSINMDWDAWYRMASMKGSFVYVPKSLMKHRIHVDSATSKGLEENLRQMEDLRMFKRLWPGWIATMLATFYSRSYKSNFQE